MNSEKRKRYWLIWSSPTDYAKAFISPRNEEGKYEVGFYTKTQLETHTPPPSWKEMPVAVAMDWAKGRIELPEEFA